MVLEVSKIYKSFGERYVLSDVSFSIEAGETVGFLGPNGAGKTTALKIILGLLSADSGKVVINGYNIKSQFEKAVSSVGAFIESPEMYGYLTGYQNLRQSAWIYKISKARLMAAAELVGLTREMLDEKVCRYSLGMRQRLGLAQAMLHSPDLLLLDEPLNGLDPAAVLEFAELIKLLNSTGVSVLLSSNQLAETELMCDRVIILESGFVVSIKKMNELIGQSADFAINYFLQTNDNEASFAILLEAGFSAKSTDSGIDICATHFQSSQIIKLLVDSDISVFSFIPEKRTLKDVFFEYTAPPKKIETEDAVK